MSYGITYYQKNTREAFEGGFTTRIHYECLDSEVYEVHKYYLPVKISPRVKWVRRYFKKLDDQPIDVSHKRRKHWLEYAETALMMLGRIYHLCSKGHRITAGSQYVSPVAWAIFGEGNPGTMARHQFSSVLEIANHYRSLLQGNCYPIDIYFKKGHSQLGRQLASKFKKPPLISSNFWMAVALLLIHDIIHECGPDCNEFFELFTNDYRDNSGSFDVISWEKLRCAILGVQGRVEVNRMPRGIHVIHREIIGPVLPIKPFKAKTEIVLLSESNDLSHGEKTVPTSVKSEDDIISRSSASTTDFTIPDLIPDLTPIMDMHSVAKGHFTRDNFIRFGLDIKTL